MNKLIPPPGIIGIFVILLLTIGAGMAGCPVRLDRLDHTVVFSE